MRNSRKVKQKLKMVMCVPSSCYGKLKNMLRNVCFYSVSSIFVSSNYCSTRLPELT